MTPRLHLEVGKRYKDRTGKIWGPLVGYFEGFLGPERVDTGDLFDWFSNGDYFDNGRESDFDLIEEIPEETQDGPIRVITKKELVPGVYGLFRVSENGSGVNVTFLDYGGAETAHNHLNIFDLRDSAKLFNQLADYLGEKNSK